MGMKIGIESRRENRKIGRNGKKKDSKKIERKGKLTFVHIYSVEMIKKGLIKSL